MRGPSPLYIEERHRALGRDATFSWSRALTHPPRCNRTRHRDHHLVSDFVGAAILVSWGPPSWIGSRGGRHVGSDVVTSLTLKWGLYYLCCFRPFCDFSTSYSVVMIVILLIFQNILLKYNFIIFISHVVLSNIYGMVSVRHHVMSIHRVEVPSC